MLHAKVERNISIKDVYTISFMKYQLDHILIVKYYLILYCLFLNQITKEELFNNIKIKIVFLQKLKSTVQYLVFNFYLSFML